MQTHSEISKAFLRKYPEQVVMVTSISKEGKPNVMPVGWIAVASGDPSMFILGIDEDSHTYSNIKSTKQFVVAYPSTDMAESTFFCGKNSGRNVDKFAKTGLKISPASIVSAPLLADAVANFECTLETEYKPGDCTLLVGRIVSAHENADKSVERLYTIGPKHKLGRVAIQLS